MNIGCLINYDKTMKVNELFFYYFFNFLFINNIDLLNQIIINNKNQIKILDIFFY